MVGDGGGVLLLAFGLTALVRFAQGSATVAMITAVAIVAPMVLEADLGFHRVYVALAIGCGSKPLPWMNDSGFWIVSKMSGMNETETLKTFSVMLSLMGVVGFGVVWLASVLIPLSWSGAAGNLAWFLGGKRSGLHYSSREQSESLGFLLSKTLHSKGETSRLFDHLDERYPAAHQDLWNDSFGRERIWCSTLGLKICEGGFWTSS
jgi:hypothetical protein